MRMKSVASALPRWRPISSASRRAETSVPVFLAEVPAHTPRRDEHRVGEQFEGTRARPRPRTPPQSSSRRSGPPDTGAAGREVPRGDRSPAPWRGHLRFAQNPSRPRPRRAPPHRPMTGRGQLPPRRCPTRRPGGTHVLSGWHRASASPNVQTRRRGRTARDRRPRQNASRSRRGRRAAAGTASATAHVLPSAQPRPYRPLRPAARRPSPATTADSGAGAGRVVGGGHVHGAQQLGFHPDHPT